MDPQNPEKEPKSLFPAVAEALLGVPAQTHSMPWPRKPLGKPTSGKGQSKAPGKSSKGHARGHSKGRSKAPKQHIYAGMFD